MAFLETLSDGTTTIRPWRPADVPTLVDGRDDVFHRFLGPGDAEPCPAACIVADGVVVGWVDYDRDRTWLDAGEVNLGYNVFAPFRGNGHTSGAVKLLMHHLAVDARWHTATLLIAPDNERSLALARRLGFTPWGDLDGNPYWKQPVSAFQSYGSVVAAT